MGNRQAQRHDDKEQPRPQHRVFCPFRHISTNGSTANANHWPIEIQKFLSH
jgi:hypothetical protein